MSERMCERVGLVFVRVCDHEGLRACVSVSVKGLHECDCEGLCVLL